MSSVSGIKAGLAYVELGANDSELQRVLKRAENRINATAKTIRTIGIGLATAGGAIAAPLFAAAISAGKYGDALGDLSIRTGVAVDDLAALQLAADQNGSSIEDVASSINKMQRNLEEAGRGSKSANDALASLGLTFEELKSKSPYQQFELLADRISKLPTASARTAAAVALLGKSGAMLLPLFKDGAAGLRAYREESDRLGHTLAAKTAVDVGEFDDAVAKAKIQVQDIKNVIGAAIASALLPYEASINSILKATIEWIAVNGDLVVGIGAIGGVSLTAGVALLGISAALNVVAGAIKIVGASMSLLTAHPLVAVGVAIAAVTVGLVALARKASKANYDVSHSAQDATSANDRARAADMARVASLQKLSEVGRLNDAQMSEAAAIISQLESSYGPLGVSIDKTTGSIIGMAGAWDKVTSAMAGAATADVQREIAAITAQISEAEREFKKTNDSWWDGFDRLDSFGTVWDALLGNPITKADIEEAMGANEINPVMAELFARLQSANKRLKEIQAGNKEAITGGQTAPVVTQSIAGEQEIQRQKDFLENLAIDKARSSGDNSLANQLEILRDFKKTLEEIKSIGLSGVDLDFGIKSAFDIAQSRLSGVSDRIANVERRSAGVFNPKAIASLNQISRSTDTTSLLRSGLSKQDEMIAQLKNIAANIVPTYEQ